MVRDYKSFCYLTDNRNFGYKQANNRNDDVGDMILSPSSLVFISALGKKPQKLNALIKRISEQFLDIGVETIKNDAWEFYSLLETQGFVVIGETPEECNEKDLRFSYKTVETQYDNLNCSTVDGSKESTQAFFEQQFNGMPQLTSILIEITSICNERCLHCYIPHDKRASHIEADLFFDILEQCKSMNLLHITLSGGEPLMHKNFIDFLKKCYEYNFSVNVLSNLTLLNDAIIEEMKRNPLLGVQVSLYSMSPDIHDEITQTKGSFEKTKNAILRLKENNIPMQISCPIIKQNIACYNDVIDWGKSHNISVGSDYVIIAKHDHTTQNLNSRISLEDVAKVVNRNIIYDPTYLTLMEKEAEEKKNYNLEDAICSVCYSSICVAENGNVYPCAGWQGCVVGNVYEGSLGDIWEHSIKVQHLRNLRKRDLPRCTQCAEKEFCSICLVRNANEHYSSDPLAINEYFCNAAKITKALIVEARDKKR
jgi:radical SAM protein with 4Fe4S-binding SPASM domain